MRIAMLFSLIVVLCSPVASPQEQPTVDSATGGATSDMSATASLSVDFSNLDTLALSVSNTDPTVNDVMPWCNAFNTAINAKIYEIADYIRDCKAGYLHQVNSISANNLTKICTAEERRLANEIREFHLVKYSKKCSTVNNTEYNNSKSRNILKNELRDTESATPPPAISVEPSTNPITLPDLVVKTVADNYLHRCLSMFPSADLSSITALFKSIEPHPSPPLPPLPRGTK